MHFTNSKNIKKTSCSFIYDTPTKQIKNSSDQKQHVNQSEADDDCRMDTSDSDEGGSDEGHYSDMIYQNRINDEMNIDRLSTYLSTHNEDTDNKSDDNTEVYEKDASEHSYDTHTTNQIRKHKMLGHILKRKKKKEKT